MTGFEYENLPGVVVTVKNNRTGESATATPDDDAVWGVDLGDTIDYPAGYAGGDEVEIRVTHRDTTRVWKRRVAGTEIQQDAYCTHGTYRGALSKAKLLVTDVLTGNTGTQVNLRDAHTRDVVSVRKNGTLLADGSLLAAPAEWSFAKPTTLTLTVALVSSDVLEVERSVLRSIAQAKTAVVEDGDALVRNAVSRYYSNIASTRIPELQHLSEVLAASRLRHLLYSGAEKVDDEAANLWKGAQSMLSELRKGERSLTDEDGRFVTPTAQASTVPRASTSPIRRQKRFTDDNVRIDL